MTLLQNQFAMSTEVGRKIAGSNVQSVEFYSATGTDTIAPGEAVCIASTTRGLVTKVAKGAAVATDDFFGVVYSNVVKEAFAVGDKIEIARNGCEVFMTASAAITAGAKLQYDYSTGKVATVSGTNSVIGRALENATADGQVIRVYVEPSKFVAHTHA